MIKFKIKTLLLICIIYILLKPQKTPLFLVNNVKKIEKSRFVRNIINRIEKDKSQRKTNDKICFFHIPRTSGDNITTSYLNCMDIDLTYWGDNKFPEIMSLKLQKLFELNNYYDEHPKTIKGFFSYGQFDDYKPDILISIIRNPIDRVLSIYYFKYKNIMSISDFLNSDDIIIQSHINNGMTWQFGHFLDKNYRKITIEETYQNAIKFINNFTFIGIFEELNKSHRNIINIIDKHLIKIKLSKKIVKYISLLATNFHNTKKNKQQFESRDIIEKIEKINYYDIKLYNYIKNKNFIERV